MSADLVGDGFEVKPLTPRSKEIPPGDQATWQWSVTPTLEGTHYLTLKTIVEGEVEGKRYPLTTTETTKTVTVRVKPGERAAEIVDAIIAWLDRMKLLLIAVAGVIGAVWLVIRRWRGRGKDGADG
jgi:hypothetical protein